ncbi:hypothetical protein BGZ70_009553 [Mortierella alpina]|uniref:Uncharacterized protein n=1 Tax=Mortierella alpina TaxID=64518 RepID=A0A9P6J132_MORAP|nr:hypothetical protein BGZ70_009553 [Mortierella alpina]
MVLLEADVVGAVCANNTGAGAARAEDGADTEAATEAGTGAGTEDGAEAGVVFAAAVVAAALGAMVVDVKDAVPAGSTTVLDGPAVLAKSGALFICSAVCRAYSSRTCAMYKLNMES